MISHEWVAKKKAFQNDDAERLFDKFRNKISYYAYSER